MSKGKIWSVIRDELPKLRNELKNAVDNQSYEMESVLFDSIARKLADKVCRATELDGEPYGN